MFTSMLDSAPAEACRKLGDDSDLKTLFLKGFI